MVEGLVVRCESFLRREVFLSGSIVCVCVSGVREKWVMAREKACDYFLGGLGMRLCGRFERF